PCDWCARWTGLDNAAQAEILRIDTGWDTFDRPTKDHLEELKSWASNAHTAQLALHASLMTHLRSQTLANAIAIRGDQGNKWVGEITAPAASDLVSVREVDGLSPCDPAAPQAVCLD